MQFIWTLLGWIYRHHRKVIHFVSLNWIVSVHDSKMHTNSRTTFHSPVNVYDFLFIFTINTDTGLRNIIDKLAEFVARNGPEFESITKVKQQGNPKFSFLYGGEHYHYYQWRTEQASKRIQNPLIWHWNEFFLFLCYLICLFFCFNSRLSCHWRLNKY